MIFGISEPVAVAILLVIVVIIAYVLPQLAAKKDLLNYSNFNMKRSNAFYHFAGSGPAPGFYNVQPKKFTVHNNGRATIELEGLPNPLVDVIIDENDKNCNVVIKRTADTLAGARVDCLINVDANSCKHEWDNVYVQNWLNYRNKFMDAAKNEVLRTSLDNKEFMEELKEVQVTAENMQGQ